ncbi:MAG: hypothetical protein KA004_15935 [Verrucomicrobiales bacterium]|nr:hypothetical protein [Verrucomicrobiales bacterium]
MNSNAFIRIVVTFAIMILALWVSMDIFAGSGNALGKFYFYVMIASFLFGLLASKKAFYYLIFLAAYLDFFKRLMILDHGIRQIDLYWVLGIAPATMAGIICSVLYQMFFGGGRIRPMEGRLVVATLIVFTLLFGIGLLSVGSGKFRALGDLVNGSIYIPMAFVIPFLFRTPGDLQRVVKVMIFIFVPSALYLIYQSFFGLTWWEHRYLQSGLSIEVRQYNERIFRCFGTMAAASTATIFYSVFVAILLGGGFWKYRPDGTRVGQSMIGLRLLLAVIYGVAAFRTFSRAGWVIGIIVLCCLVVFHFRALTIAFYATFLAASLTIVFLSPYLLRHKVLNELDSRLASASDETRQAAVLSTLNDRLEGFNALMTNRSIWTPFGFRFAGKSRLQEQVFLHDAFTAAVIRFGYVTLGGILFLGISLLVMLHRFVLHSPRGISRELACLGLSAFVALLIGGITNTAAYTTFPQNMLLHFFLGVCTSLIVLAKTQEKEQEEADSPNTSGPQRTLPYRSGQRRPAYS